VPPGRPEVLAEAIRSARDGGLDLDALGVAGRDYVVANAGRAAAVDKYRTLLREAAAAS
jgi:hypothetical protein